MAEDRFAGAPTPLLEHALKLLARRERTAHQLRERLATRFGNDSAAIEEVLARLSGAGYLDDERYARNWVRRRIDRGRVRLAGDLERAGIAPGVIRRVLEDQDWPSLVEALRDKMGRFGIGRPLAPADAARLSRTLQRLGYDADEIASELDRLR